MANRIPEYDYYDATCWSNYLWPTVKKIIDRHIFKERRALDIGCGNGSISNLLTGLGFQVIGVDPSESGIRTARANFPHIEFHKGSAYDDLLGQYGPVSLVVSLEVIEHCFEPRKFARTLYAVLDDGGMAIVSTPYHGYLKNLALAVAGKWNDHLGPLWDGGHIKFFSMASLRTLLTEVGFRDIRFIRAGRIPPLAKSIVAIATK